MKIVPTLTMRQTIIRILFILEWILSMSPLHRLFHRRLPSICRSIFLEATPVANHGGTGPLIGLARLSLAALCFLSVFDPFLWDMAPSDPSWTRHLSTAVLGVTFGVLCACVVIKEHRRGGGDVSQPVEDGTRPEPDGGKPRAHLESVFACLKHALVVLNKDMEFIEVNPAAAAMCGIRGGTLGGKAPFEEVPECNRRCLEAARKAAAGHKPVELQRLECRRKGHPGRLVSSCAYPLLDAREKFGGVVMINRIEPDFAAVGIPQRQPHPFPRMVGNSEKMLKVCSRISALAKVQSTVLITGESGTGKELVVEAIHHHGGKSSRPLVKVNCSVLPETLFESELFGHTRGSFTGAVRDTKGRFELADGGTIFLDEIGNLSLPMQLKLLRVIQEKKFERIGDPTPVEVNVRIVAATNNILLDKVRTGEFREDLFYRLNVVEISLPPLRERKEDIPLLVDHFLEMLNARHKKRIPSVSADVIDTFMEYDWPGNVRELEHSLEHAYIMCPGKVVTLDYLPENICKVSRCMFPMTEKEKLERASILEILGKTGGNKVQAARLLGINRRTLYRKLKTFNMT